MRENTFMDKSHWKLHEYEMRNVYLSLTACRVWYWLCNPANPVYASFMNMNICQYVKGHMTLSLPGPLELQYTV